MKAEALLAKNAEPSREEIAHALLGNLCRCTGYVKIVDAVLLAAAARRGEPLPEPDRSGRVGTRAARYEGPELALGDTPFVGDMIEPGMLHGALRFSDHPRARILRIDTSKARGPPGRLARSSRRRTSPASARRARSRRTGASSSPRARRPPTSATCSPPSPPRPRRAAREAAALVEVEYEVLDPVTDPFDPRAERPLDVGREARRRRRGARRRRPRRHRDATGRSSSSTPSSSPSRRSPCPEGYAALRVYSQGQGIWDDRRQIASFLGRPRGLGARHARPDRRRLRREGRPERPVPRRAARLADTAAGAGHAQPQGEPPLPLQAPRDVARVHRRLRRGRPPASPSGPASSATRGAYASVGDKVLERAAGHACGAYKVPNVDVEARAVYTNNPPCGAMRGFGVNQSNFAIEGVLDLLAEQVGIDGWEIRWRNALEEGDRFGTGQMLGPGVGLKKTLLAVRDAYRDARFAGIACGVKNTGIGNGMVDRGRVDPAARSRRHRHALPLLDGDGPGRPHRPPADRLRGARPAARADPGRRRHRASSSRPARRPRRARPSSAATP